MKAIYFFRMLGTVLESPNLFSVIVSVSFYMFHEVKSIRIEPT